jgi:hypothetical protein
MSRTIIENTDSWTLVSIGNGAAYEFTHKRSGDSLFIQYGDDATEFRAAYEALEKAYLTEGTPYHEMTWNHCLADLFSRYAP